MEQQKALAIASILCLDTLHGCCEQTVVLLAMQLGGVREVGKQPEQQVVVPVGQEAHLELFHFIADAVGAHEHHGHDNERPKSVRDARFLKIHLGQCPRRQHSCDQIVDHFDGNLAGRNEQQQREAKPDPLWLSTQAQDDQGN